MSRSALFVCTLAAYFAQKTYPRLISDLDTPPHDIMNQLLFVLLQTTVIWTASAIVSVKQKTILPMVLALLVTPLISKRPQIAP